MFDEEKTESQNRSPAAADELADLIAGLATSHGKGLTRRPVPGRPHIGSDHRKCHCVGSARRGQCSVDGAIVLGGVYDSRLPS
jgi:hypothetical protein